MWASLPAPEVLAEIIAETDGIPALRRGWRRPRAADRALLDRRRRLAYSARRVAAAGDPVRLLQDSAACRAWIGSCSRPKRGAGRRDHRTRVLARLLGAVLRMESRRLAQALDELVRLRGSVRRRVRGARPEALAAFRHAADPRDAAYNLARSKGPARACATRRSRSEIAALRCPTPRPRFAPSCLAFGTGR